MSTVTINTVLTTTMLPDPPGEHILRLSENIAEKTRSLTASLKSGGLPLPSSDAVGPSEFALSKMGHDDLKLREELIAQTKELHDLLVGPSEGMKALAKDVFGHVSIQAICNLQVAECVPRETPISYEELTQQVSQRTGSKLQVPVLRKLIRLAMANNIFYEPKWGYVAHNSYSLLLLEDELSSYMSWFSTDMLPACANALEAFNRWPASQEPNETALNIAFNHDMPTFEHFGSDPVRERRLELMLRSYGSRHGYEFSHTVNSYPWADLGQATVVDIGGLDGAMAMAIAEEHPSLSFVVQDMPKMRPESCHKGVPAHLRNRVSLTAHDCFTPQTVVAEAYFFRFMFHTMSDKYAIKTLQALVPALRQGARIIINELMLTEPGTVSKSVEKNIRAMDVMAQMLCNSTEREVEDWKRLFASADERFKWQGARKSSGALWLIEATWEE